MLEYLKRTDVKEYNRIVQDLGLATKRQIKAAQQSNNKGTTNTAINQ